MPLEIEGEGGRGREDRDDWNGSDNFIAEAAGLSLAKMSTAERGGEEVVRAGLYQ